MITAVSQKELTSQDRCDRCSARALVRATLLSGELYFCGHHIRETKEKLKTTAVTIYDPEGLLDSE